MAGEHLEMLSSPCGVHTAHASSYVPHGMKQVVQPAPGLVAARPVLLNGQSTSVPIAAACVFCHDGTRAALGAISQSRLHERQRFRAKRENSFQQSVGRQIRRETWTRMMSQVGWLMLASLRRAAARKTAG